MEPLKVEHLEAIRGELNLSFEELWFAYVEVGGSRSLPQLVGHLIRGEEWPFTDHVCVIVALNDRFCDLGMGQPLAYPGDTSEED